MSALAVDSLPPPATAPLPLRPYQEQALAAIEAAGVRGWRRVLAVLPTGSGKTPLFSHLIHRRGGRALIVAPRNELLRQAVDKLLMVDPTAEIGLVKAEADEHGAPIVVARPTRSRPLYQQMVGRGSHRFPGKDDCLVIDVVGATVHNSLVTAASLFGRLASALVGATVAETIARRHPPLPAPKPAGELVSVAVELSRRRPVHWVPAGGGRFALATGQGSLVLRQRDQAWDVIQLPPQGSPGLLASGLDLGYAQGLAEDHARALGAGPLLQRDAAWRFGEPSPKQLGLLRRLGVRCRPGMTKGEASDLISAAFAAHDLLSEVA